MTTITRDELYALVWSEPIQRIAPRYNISDRGLGKLCERNGIPVPPRGWWAKKAAGERVRLYPLPPIEKGQYAVITIEGQKGEQAQATLGRGTVAAGGDLRAGSNERHRR